MLLSIVIPCYNEAKNIQKLITRCSELINSDDIELLFIDNGSTDNTRNLLKKNLNNKKNVRIIKIDINEGYGKGILTGLKATKGDILAWTHADLQTDPKDLIRAFKLFKKNIGDKNLFVKGIRKGRSKKDLFFTWSMSILGIFFLHKRMIDINGQPNMFPRSFFEKWENPPTDFSLDLFVYYTALKNNLIVKRLYVNFDTRKFGVGHNEKLKSKIVYSLKTIKYMFCLKLKLT